MARDLLVGEDPPTAVFAASDVQAIGVLEAAGELGLRVPEDVAVIGFDDIDETRYSIPTLSTIDPGRDEIARAAVDLLIRRIEGDDEPFVPEAIEVPFRLVERESSAS